MFSHSELGMTRVSHASDRDNSGPTVTQTQRRSRRVRRCRRAWPLKFQTELNSRSISKSRYCYFLLFYILIFYTHYLFLFYIIFLLCNYFLAVSRLLFRIIFSKIMDYYTHYFISSIFIIFYGINYCYYCNYFTIILLFYFLLFSLFVLRIYYFSSFISRLIK